MKTTKSRKLRKVFVKTPGNQIIVQYKKRNIKGVFCSHCNKKLNIQVLIHSKFRNLPKTNKRTNRAYSNLCSACSRRTIVQKARLQFIN